MKIHRINLVVLLLLTLLFYSCDSMKDHKSNRDMANLMIRIAEIEIDTNYVEEYMTILKKESEASVRLEPGVISIYPMYQRENPTQIRLLEIYASKEAYETHLRSPHFQEYKTTTKEMVKSLKLIDMVSIDPDNMPRLFTKLRE